MENVDEENTYDLSLKPGFLMQVIGPSSCGKTSLILKICSSNLLSPKPDFTVYFYKEYNPCFENYPDILFVDGFDPKYISKDFLKKFNSSLAIFDDLLDDLKDSPVLGNVATRLCHHRNLSAIIVQQNCFPKNFKASTDVSRNATYKIIFRSNSDKLQILNLGRVICPGKAKFWSKVVDECLQKAHDHIMLDFHKDQDQKLMIRNSVFPETGTVCYIPFDKDHQIKEL